MTIAFHALPDDAIRAWRAGAPDAYGAPAERIVSDGTGNPCRCCLQDVAAGEEMLLLAHMPFPAPQPYAETGPIFLHAECLRRATSAALPPVVAARGEFLVKPYCGTDRIAAPGGSIVATSTLRAHCEALLTRADIAYVDIRSAVNNCFICRVKAN